jgi:succinate dehydrogenase / fumarate reductase flavoprotein subunit
MKKVHPKNHATSIPGLYACGECDSAYHGANRLGANSLLSATFSGIIAGDAAVAHVKGLKKRSDGTPDARYEGEKKRQEAINQKLISSDGKENAFALHHEMGDIMREHVFVERDNKGLDKALQGLRSSKERSEKIRLDDGGSWSNQSLSWARQIKDMIVMAEVITKGARLRDECRGSHYKAEFELKIPEGKFKGDPEFEAFRARWKASNEKWLKTTVATCTPDGPKIEFQPVELNILPPAEPRDYR